MLDKCGKATKMYKNIVLIGMPGSGKTTIGKALSYKLKRAFVDLDTFIETKTGMTVFEIFEKNGEEYFRQLETDACEYFSQNYENTIISTGGGVILKDENIKHLKNTGKIIYINRSAESILKTLNVEKRPLLKNNPDKLYEMYKERHLLYLKYAEICVMNDGNFHDCVENIYSIIK